MPALKRWVSLAPCHRIRTDGRASQATFHRRETRSQKSQSRTYRKDGSNPPTSSNAARRIVTAEQRSGLPCDHRRRQAAGRDDPVDRPEPAASHDGLGDRITLLVDDLGRAGHQADRFVPRECRDVRREVAGLHDVVLVEDGDDRRAGESDAPVPVPGEAQPLGIDLDARPIAGHRANHVERPVV